MDLIFINTCIACPEQYNVLDSNGQQVAYVRLRYGKLKATVPDVGGTVVYAKEFEDSLKGIFDNNQERLDHLNSIAKVLRGVSFII